MSKVIHYCWFGDKSLPKSAERYIKSWKKYLPDFEIKLWNEDNFDVNECEFIKQAYINKKWAFVSDYVRMKVLYEYGGMYLDTDMELIKDIDKLLDIDFFIGREDSGYIAAGVIWVKNKENKYINEILNYYLKQKEFDTSDLFKYAIPKVITKILSKYDIKEEGNIQNINNEVYIYPSEYFYPINYDYTKKQFTNNTCMVHYYNAAWVSKKEKIILTCYRKLGMKNGRFVLKLLLLPYSIFNKTKNSIYIKYGNLKYKLRMGISIHFNIDKRIKLIEKRLDKLKGYNYVVVHNPDWMGVSNSTTDMFKSTLKVRDVFTEKEAKKIAECICRYNKKLVVFSGFARGYSAIIEHIHNIDSNIKIKVLWHGSNALLVEYTDWIAFNLVLMLYKQGKIHEIAFFKKSMYEFFKQKKYKVYFLMNVVNVDLSIYDKQDNKIGKNKKTDSEKKEIDVIDKDTYIFGLYASLDRWIKNTYNQISAISLFENCKIDITPMSDKAQHFAETLGLDTTLSSSGNVKRIELLRRMSRNDINLYVTFTECSPMIPLESLEVGVPCITGDNHHYFENSELEKYLVVSKTDNIMSIYEKMLLCLENKEKILMLYKEWKKQYVKEAENLVEDFLKS